MRSYLSRTTVGSPFPQRNRWTALLVGFVLASSVAALGSAELRHSPVRGIPVFGLASSQDLETNTSWFDAYSVYSLGKVATNPAGESAVVWNDNASRVTVARLWKNGSLSPSVGLAPLVLFSNNSAFPGVVTSNLTAGQLPNMDVKAYGDHLYLCFVADGSTSYVVFAQANFTSSTNLSDYRSWHSANGKTAPFAGGAWNGYGVDLLNDTAFSSSVVATKDGRIVIAVQHSASLTMDILYYNGTGWSKGTIYPFIGAGDPDLEIDDWDNLHLFFLDESSNEVLAATCYLGTRGDLPTLASNWKNATGVSGFDSVIGRSGSPLYVRTYGKVWGSEMRVVGLANNKSTFYFNVWRNGTWLAGTGSLSGWVVPNATSQPRYPYTFYQWSIDASGNSYLFWEQAKSVYSITWNGTAWSLPFLLGNGGYINVIGQAIQPNPGQPLLVYSLNSAMPSKLVLFELPTPGSPPLSEGPRTGLDDSSVTPASFLAPSNLTVNATIDDRYAGNCAIANAEFFFDSVGATGSGIPLLPVSPPSYHVSNLTAVTWSSPVNFTEGIHTVWVHGLDDCGHWGPYSSTTFTVLPPRPPTSRIATSWFGWTTTGTVVVGYQAWDHVGLRSVSLWVSRSADNETFGNWASTATQTQSGTSVTGSFRFTVADGPGWYRILTNATDVFGLSENLTAKVPSLLGYDAGAPSASVHVPSYWSTTSNATLSLAAADDAGLADITLLLSSSPDNLTFAPWVVYGNWSATSVNWSVSWRGELSDGYYRAGLQVTDVSGKTFSSEPGGYASFAVDAHPPGAQLASVLPTFVPSEWPLGYVASDNVGLHEVRLLVAHSLDGTNWSDWGVQAVNSAAGSTTQGSFQVSSGTSEGWLRVAVVAVDLAGNPSLISSMNSGVVRIDLVPPSLSIANITAGSWVPPSRHVWIIASRGSYAEYRFDGAGTWLPVPPDGNVTLLSLYNGAHTLYALATDSSGNANRTSVFFRVDGDSPKLVWCSSPFSDMNGELILCWSASDATSGIATQKLSIDGEIFSLPANATEWSGVVSPGTHKVSLSATDVAGNSAMISLRAVPTYTSSVASILLFAVPIAAGILIFLFVTVWFWRQSRRP